MASTGWRRHDTHWVISLFGTAVGAGILFLPINLGLGDLALIIVAVLAGPMTFLAHRGLARFVLSSSRPQADFTEVAEEHFGKMAGRLISALYFLSIFPILLIYGVGLTNTVESFMVNQLGLASPDRVMLSGVLVFAMIAVMLAGEKAMLRAFAVMVYPLAAILLALSCYLIPQWQWPEVTAFEGTSFLNTVWLALPVTVFAFSHAAAISGFANVQRRVRGAGRNQERPDPAQHHRHAGGLRALLRLLLRAEPLPGPVGRGQGPERLRALLSRQHHRQPGDRDPGAAHRLHRHQLLLPRPLPRCPREPEKPDRQAHRPAAGEGGQARHRPDVLRHLGRRHHQPGHSGVDGDPLRPVIAMILFIMPVVAIYKVEALALLPSPLGQRLHPADRCPGGLGLLFSLLK